MRDEVRQQVDGKKAYLATADGQGHPHVAIAEVVGSGEETLEVHGWLCPGTLNNIDQNKQISVVVEAGDDGYQFMGRVESKTVDAVMDGFDLDREAVPNVRYRLLVRVDSVLPMTARAHSDRSLE